MAGYIGYVTHAFTAMSSRWLVPWARAFALGSLLHLTLPDFDQPGWTGPMLLELVGALWLLIRPSPWAFALCGLSTLWPLLLLRDVLTQSALLTAFAGIGVAGCLGWRDALSAARLITAATYGLAALHKLNSAFFDPLYSCANHAWVQVVERTPALALLPMSDAALPYAAVGLELAVGWAVWRRSRWMWPLGVLFHVPLTVTLAPAFAGVMLIGYAAAVPARDWVRLRRLARTRGPLIVGIGLAAGALDLALVSGSLAPAVSAKVALAGALVAWTAPLLRLSVRRVAPAGRAARWVVVVWVAHGLTPYFGIQYQHTAAMLSNLRIDAGCHNSLVLPEALRGVDPYIRIDAASIGDGARPGRERLVEATLWSVPALHTMRRNWCIPELRPIHYRGTWRGEPFEIDDLCAEHWLDALPGAEWLPGGLQRFQKNLLRACPTVCVH